MLYGVDVLANPVGGGAVGGTSTSRRRAVSGVRKRCEIGDEFAFGGEQFGDPAGEDVEGGGDLGDLRRSTGIDTW